MRVFHHVPSKGKIYGGQPPFGGQQPSSCTDEIVHCFFLLDEIRVVFLCPQKPCDWYPKFAKPGASQQEPPLGLNLGALWSGRGIHVAKLSTEQVPVVDWTLVSLYVCIIFILDLGISLIVCISKKMTIPRSTGESPWCTVAVP